MGKIRNTMISLLLVSCAALVSCSAPEELHESQSDAASSPAETASSASSPVPGSVVGEYLSEAGDGEILKLNEDGTFVSYTVTDMSTTDNAVTMTETVTGTYSKTETGECQLTISGLTVKAEGIEDDPEQIKAYVDLLAGDDEEMRAMYTRLFGGEEITGEEMYGRDAFASLAEEGAIVQFDFENSTFAYQVKR